MTQGGSPVAMMALAPDASSPTGSVTNNVIVGTAEMKTIVIRDVEAFVRRYFSQYKLSLTHADFLCVW